MDKVRKLNLKYRADVAIFLLTPLLPHILLCHSILRFLSELIHLNSVIAPLIRSLPLLSRGLQKSLYIVPHCISQVVESA